MRNVKVFSTKLNKTTVLQTSATNWGELSTYLTSKGLFNPGGMKAVERDSKATLEHKEAILPDGDFTLVLIPTKNESGGFIDADEFGEWLDERFNELKEDIAAYLEENEVTDEEASLAAEAKELARELGL